MQFINDPSIKPLHKVDFFSPMHRVLVEQQENQKRKRKEEEEQIEEEKQLVEESLEFDKKKEHLQKRGKYGEYTKETKETILKYAELHGAAKASRRFAGYNNGQGIPERTSKIVFLF